MNFKCSFRVDKNTNVDENKNKDVAKYDKLFV